MFAGKFGKDYSDSAAYRWNPRPYGHPGFTFDYLPDHPEFFNVESHPYTVSADGKISDADIDILYGNTVFRKEATATRIEAAAQKGVKGISPWPGWPFLWLPVYSRTTNRFAPARRVGGHTAEHRQTDREIPEDLQKLRLYRRVREKPIRHEDNRSDV